MENKVSFIQWSLDKWRYVRFLGFRAPFTRLSNAVEIIYTLPFTLDSKVVKQIDDFVLEAVRKYDSGASVHGLVVNCDEHKNVLLERYSRCKKTTFIVYDNPDSADVMDSFEKGRTKWWSFRVLFNVYVSPYVDAVDFQVYDNGGSFMCYHLADEALTESLFQSIWDNAGKIEEL